MTCSSPVCVCDITAHLSVTSQLTCLYFTCLHCSDCCWQDFQNKMKPDIQGSSSVSLLGSYTHDSKESRPEPSHLWLGHLVACTVWSWGLPDNSQVSLMSLFITMNNVLQKTHKSGNSSQTLLVTHCEVVQILEETIIMFIIWCCSATVWTTLLFSLERKWHIESQETDKRQL